MLIFIAFDHRSLHLSARMNFVEKILDSKATTLIKGSGLVPG